MNNIKQIRKSLGMNVTELAQRLGMSQGNLTKIENGQVDLKMETATAISKALRCPIEKLFCENEKPSSVENIDLHLPANCRIFTVPDDCMSPLFKTGDIAVIRPASLKNENGVYLLQKQERSCLRRLQTLSDGRIAVLCDNTGYQPEYAHEEEIHIQGFVVSKITVTNIA